MIKEFNNKSDGFTLIEVIAAIVLISIAIVPILGYFTNSIFFVSEATTRSQALDMASDLMEYYKSIALAKWDNLSPNMNESYVPSDFVFFSDYDFLQNDYGIDVVTDPSYSNIKKISVTVTWDNGNKEVKLNSLVRKRW